MDLIICFIDDSEFEHTLVKDEIAPLAPELTFVQAYSFEEAREILDARIPVLFLLDLWGQDPAVRRPFLTPKEELLARAAAFKTIDSVYQGLEELKGDKHNEYLKRLFTIVDSWRIVFEDVCNRLGQNREYGLSNLRQARGLFPGVPAVFYTRKSLVNDAIAVFRAGADGLFIKPTGKNDSDTRLLTRNYGPTLIHEFALTVDRHLPLLKEKQNLYKSLQKGEEPELVGLIEAWKRFRDTEKSQQALP